MKLSTLSATVSRVIPLIISLRLVAGTKCVASIAEPIYFRLGSCTISANPAWYPDGVTKIDSWGLQISVGNPPQPLCVEPSMVVNNLILMTSDVCTTDLGNGTIAQCASRRGGMLDSAASTSEFNVSSPDILALDPGWEQFNGRISQAASANIDLPSDISLETFPIGLPENTTNSSVGQLGINSNSTFLRRLLESGVSAVNGFSFSAGSQSPIKPRDGHLIIGGYDQGSLTGPFTTFPMNGTVTAGKRSCALHVVVDGLILSRPGQADFPIISAGTTMPSCIEPLDNLFRFPEDKLLQFQLLSGWSNNTSISKDLIVVEPGLYYDSPFNGTLKFSLQGGLNVEIPAGELSWQARGLDINGAKVLDKNITVINVFDQNAPEDTAILSKVFLSQLSLVVNYDLQQFKLAPINTETAGALDVVSFNNSSSFDCTSTPSQNNGQIGVIVLAVILGVLILLILLYFYKKRRLSDKQTKIDDGLIKARKDSEAPEVFIQPNNNEKTERLASNSSGIPPSKVEPTPVSPLDPSHKSSDFIHFPDLESPKELGSSTNLRSRST